MRNPPFSEIERNRRYPCQYESLCAHGDVGNALSAFAEDYVLRKYGYEIARNEAYDVDINRMIRKTIKDFIGKEKQIKQMLEGFDAELSLEIVPYLRIDCEDPNPILSPDDDIIAFLYKAGVKLDIDYYLLH